MFVACTAVRPARDNSKPPPHLEGKWWTDRRGMPIVVRFVGCFTRSEASGLGALDIGEGARSRSLGNRLHCAGQHPQLGGEVRTSMANSTALKLLTDDAGDDFHHEAAFHNPSCGGKVLLQSMLVTLR